MNDLPLLLTRQEAAKFLGIDPKSFDKYIRSHPDFQSFFIGKQERFTKQSIINFVENHTVT